MIFKPVSKRIQFSFTGRPDTNAGCHLPVMILTFHFIILKHVNRYRIFRNNKNTDKLDQNNVVYFKGVTFVSALIKLRLTCIYLPFTVT